MDRMSQVAHIGSEGPKVGRKKVLKRLGRMGSESSDGVRSSIELHQGPTVGLLKDALLVQKIRQCKVVDPKFVFLHSGGVSSRRACYQPGYLV